MNKRRFFLIIFFLICLFSCCNETYRIELPSTQANQGQANIINIYIDKNFNLEENIIIHQSLNNWHRASSNIINFNTFDKVEHPGQLEDFFWKKQYNHSIFIWHADSKSISEKFDDKYASYAGMWDIHGNIVIFADRVDSKTNELHNIMTHELGHMLGLKHIIYQQSVMQPKSDDISNCITKDDANRLCVIYGCVPNPECD